MCATTIEHLSKEDSLGCFFPQPSLKWQGHDLSVQDFPGKTQKIFKNSDHFNHALISSPEFDTALVSSILRKRREAQKVSLSNRICKKISQLGIITSITRNTVSGAASAAEISEPSKLITRVIPTLRFSGAFLGVIANGFAIHSACNNEKMAQKIGDKEGAQLAAIDKWVCGSIWVIDVVLTTFFAIMFASVTIPALVVTSVALNALCGVLYLALLCKSGYMLYALQKFGFALEQALKEGTGIEFLHKQIHLTQAEQEKIDQLPLVQRAIVKENLIAQKLEKFIRNTDAGVAEEAARFLAEKTDPKRIFQLVRKANYTNRVKTVVRIAGEILGLGATTVGLLCPIAAPASFIAAGSGLVWLFTSTKLNSTAEKWACRKFDIDETVAQKKRFELPAINLLAVFGQTPSHLNALTPNY